MDPIRLTLNEDWDVEIRLIRRPGPPVRVNGVENILRAVELVTGVARHILRSKAKPTHVVFARVLAAHLLNKKLCLSPKRIGTHLNRERTGVAHELRLATNLLDTSKAFRLLVLRADRLLDTSDTPSI